MGISSGVLGGVANAQPTIEDLMRYCQVSHDSDN